MLRFSDVQFIFSCGIVGAMLWVNGCRSTSPRATRLPPEPVAQIVGDVATSERPQATLTDSVPQSKDDLNVAVKPHRHAELPQGYKPVVWQYAHVSRAMNSLKNDQYAWKVDLKTAAEIWCETRCSDFKLFDQHLEGDRQLIAMKMTKVGKTTPGMLSVRSTINGSRERAKRVILEHVGAMDHSVVIESVLANDQTEFYAAPMVIKPVLGSDGVTRFLGTLNQDTYQLEFASGLNSPVIDASQKEASAFVTGTIDRGSKSKTSGAQIFVVSTMILPWSGD